MERIPDTRQSLLLRVKDPADRDAWAEFVSIYRPAVLRFALRRGLQLADAEDVTQRVFMSVARAIPDWNASKDAGSFRAWLIKVTRNNVINAISRQPRAKASGGTSSVKRWNETLDERTLEEDLDWELRRAEFRDAAEKVKRDFDAATWQAFWLTMVENREISEVAKELGKSTGSIYAARSRVMRRIKKTIEGIEQ